MALKVPIGIDDFKTLIDMNFLYVDKTMLIEEVLSVSAAVQLITRPRRFGKTLNLTMLRYFFDCNASHAALFRGLAIENRPCFELLGTFPVVSLSFKNLKADDFELFWGLFANMMADLFNEYEYLLPTLNQSESKKFEAIRNEEASQIQLIDSLAFLLKLLERYHSKKVILLLDEYDSPIHEAYAKNYYEKVLGMMRPFLGKALKGNTSLEKAVLTGILRVAKESIFSDLNNLDVYTVLDTPYADKFGFRREEVGELLQKAGLSGEQAKVDQWYNGYLMGETVIYNPWSILKYVDRPSQGFVPHWINTSSNQLIREQILAATPEVHEQLNRLIQGGTVETTIEQHTVFRDIEKNSRALWSLFLFSGYLKVAQRERRDHKYYYQLGIPNLEIKQLFEDIITDWLTVSYGANPLEEMYRCLLEGDFDDLEQHLSGLVASLLSFYDTEKRYAERVYHAFVLGLVVHLKTRYEIYSNRESGFGRYDLLMRPRNKQDRGIVMEFKVAESPELLESALDQAEKQMRARACELQEAGVKLYSEIAVAFCGKQVRLRGREIES